MGAAPSVVVHRDSDLLVAAVAARFITTVVDVQAAGRTPQVVLTGGGIADRIHRAVAASAARDAVNWRNVEFWWGDERFAAADDADRNERQARHALLDHVGVDPARVHPMPASDGAYPDADDAAAAYARELAAAADDREPVPRFDVLMLGVGPDGHVASLFPQMPALDDERLVAGVHGSPKPPPTRVTLTLPTLQHASEVWFVVSGAEKAPAVQRALDGADVVQIPAAGPQGRQRTLWLVDHDAASHLP